MCSLFQDTDFGIHCWMFISFLSNYFLTYFCYLCILIFMNENTDVAISICSLLILCLGYGIRDITVTKEIRFSCPSQLSYHVDSLG